MTRALLALALIGCAFNFPTLSQTSGHYLFAWTGADPV